MNTSEAACRILCIEGNAAEARLVEEFLAEAANFSFHFSVATSVSEGLKSLTEKSFDVVLLDLAISNGRGLNTFKAIKSLGIHAPVVVLTSLADESVGSKALRHGAEDYLVKGDLDADAMARSLRYAIERHRSETAVAHSEGNFRRIFEDVPVGIFQSSLEGRILACNSAIVEMMGCSSKDELIGEDSRVFFERPEDLEKILKRVVHDGPIRDYEVCLKRKDGTSLTVSTSVAVVEHQPKFLEGILVDITERKQAEEELRYLANHDSLTGLLNRRCFQEKVAAQIAERKQQGGSGVLLWLDIDQFKEINDSFGREAGNTVLKGVASVLAEIVRESDTLAHVGGDEFAILLPRARLLEGQNLAARILSAFNHHTVVVGEQPARVTVSIGIAGFGPRGPNVEKLLTAANLAMFDAKEEGRNRFVVSLPERTRQRKLEDRASWAAKIRNALDEDKFELYAQPILNLEDDQVYAYELLLRLREGPNRVVLPGAFLDIAGRFGLMEALDRRVIELAFRASVLTGQRFHINLSGAALSDNAILALIKAEILSDPFLNPHLLIWEITETVAIKDLTRAKNFISSLRSLGCEFALDDFGIGFSSFYQLRQLPVDYIKIEGRFVQGLTTDAMDCELVDATVRISKAAGAKTIAEWVETKEQLSKLKQLGANFAQGFYIGRPRPVSEMLSVDEREAIGSCSSAFARQAAAL